MRALVLGDDTRSFLAVVRSLGRAGWEVDAAPYDFRSAALASRYLRAVHRLPPYSLAASRWTEALAALVAAEGYDLIIPCDDRGVVPLARHAGELGGSVRLALPNEEAMAAFYDKEGTRNLAQALGVPVAPGRVLRPGEEAAALAAELGLPLALKPRASYTLGQAGAKSAVRIVRSEAALAAALAGIERPGEWLAESFFRGVGIGLSVLADRGALLLAFQHRRLAEASETGGSSSRISEPIDPALHAAVAALAEAASLHGVAMFEFRRDPATGAFILLEVNARFWGSLPLALAAGADFPAAAAALYTGGTPRPDRRYRAGVVRRDLGGEYYRVLKEAEKAGGIAARLRLLATGLGRLALALPRAEGFDSFAADDPAPWRRDRSALIRTFTRAAAKRLPQDRRRRARAAIRRLAARAAAGRRQVVMLCHGNICRSPFAEHVLRARAARAGLALDIVSAGTIGLEGRASPPDAVAAARAYGTDLGGHRSRFLDVDAARAAGAVVVFDDRNVDELRRLGLNGDVNLLRLADLTGRPEIGDPYGHGPAGFAAAYAQIDEAVERLVDGLAAAGAKR